MEITEGEYVNIGRIINDAFKFYLSHTQNIVAGISRSIEMITLIGM
jgi:hypothetical protein